MGDSLELIGKRLFLLLSESGSDSHGADGAEPPPKAGPRRDWLRGTVRAVSVIGLAAPEAGGGQAAAGLTVSVYIHSHILGNSEGETVSVNVWVLL